MICSNKRISILKHILLKKIEWLKQVKQGQEDANDPQAIIDIFSVKGPLRKWIGLTT